MKEQGFFMIDKQELVLDKVLVEFDETPVFFVCRNARDYYISLCADLEEERYIVTRIPLGRLARMLHGKITMRESVLQAKRFWDISIGEDAEKDIVVEKSMDEIPLDILPYEGACLKVATKDLEEYVEKIDAILYGDEGWQNSVKQGGMEYIVEVSEGLDVRYEIVVNLFCKRVIESMKIIGSSILCNGDYGKAIRNSKVEIHKNNTKVSVNFLDNNGFPYAA